MLPLDSAGRTANKPFIAWQPSPHEQGSLWPCTESKSLCVYFTNSPFQVCLSFLPASFWDGPTAKTVFSISTEIAHPTRGKTDKCLVSSFMVTPNVLSLSPLSSYFISSSLPWSQPWKFPGLISSTSHTWVKSTISVSDRLPIMCWYTRPYWRTSRIFRPGQGSLGGPRSPAWTLTATCPFTNSREMTQVETDFPAGHAFQVPFESPHTTEAEAPSLLFFSFLPGSEEATQFNLFPETADGQITFIYIKPAKGWLTGVWKQGCRLSSWARAFSPELASRKYPAQGLLWPAHDILLREPQGDHRSR